jgi:hypothetical protein
VHSFEIFPSYEKAGWKLSDIPWENLLRDKIRPEYVSIAKSAVMGECNVIAALHGFLNEAVDDYDFSAYAAIWAYQELQHHYVFKTWLQQIDEDVEPARVEATRQPYPPGITPAATIATNIISELTVCHVYDKVSRHVEEPVFLEILQRASQDESRHAREFTYYTRRRIEQHPDELESVLETLYVYTADPRQDVKHPVSLFKGSIPELQGHETIDDGFAYFMSLDENNLNRVRQRIYRTFSSLTGFPLDTPASVRRALRRVIAAQ